MSENDETAPESSEPADVVPLLPPAETEERFLRRLWGGGRLGADGTIREDQP